MKTSEKLSRSEQYEEYLRSDHWRELRLRAIMAHGDSCACCADKPIQMHHLRYGTWYDVTTDDLVPLCDRCHGFAHSHKKADRLVYSDRPSSEKRARLLAILKSLTGKTAFAPKQKRSRRKRDAQAMARRVKRFLAKCRKKKLGKGVKNLAKKHPKQTYGLPPPKCLRLMPYSVFLSKQERVRRPDPATTPPTWGATRLVRKDAPAPEPTADEQMAEYFTAELDASLDSALTRSN